MDGQAKDGDRVGWPSRRPLGDGGVSRASDLGQLFNAWRDKLIEDGLEAPTGKEEPGLSGSCAGGWPSWSRRWAVRRMSWRSCPAPGCRVDTCTRAGGRFY